jgi:hypothetical protein
MQRRKVMITTRKHLTMTNFERNETIIAFFFLFFGFSCFFFPSNGNYRSTHTACSRSRVTDLDCLATDILLAQHCSFFFLLLGSKRFDLNCMALNLASKRASCFFFFGFFFCSSFLYLFLVFFRCPFSLACFFSFLLTFSMSIFLLAVAYLGVCRRR